MTIIYMPILRWKQGERKALQRLSPQGKTNVTPLIVIMPDAYVSASIIAQQIRDHWGLSKILVDAAYLPGSSTQHALDDIRTAGGTLGLHLVPAIPHRSTADYVNAVSRMMTADNQGLGIRISLNQMAAAASWLPNFPFAQNQTDLIVDLRNSASDVSALGASAVQAFVSLHNANGWRSVTLSGGSIPANLTGYAVGSTELERFELNLWQSIYTAGLNYQLDFGDYATIGPNASSDPVPGPVPINAKYTHRSHFQILHGVRETGQNGISRAIQYRAHANAILNYPTGYQPVAHCWADVQIPIIAAGSGSAGSPTTWVTNAVNRHIEITRSQLP